ncbi:unnamed protein product [Cuscuta europaea]|uniref:DUF4283 domain-containing protein n=1 Tax=Cuscuta europaea TaxID=41803 RepID=A0A9P1EAJ2_CUSEU|nr:unnamed protein product [Cuscuta europaea]
MVRNKPGTGVTPIATRSSSRFSVLETMAEDFPALNADCLRTGSSGKAATAKAIESAATLPNKSVTDKPIASVAANNELTAGKLAVTHAGTANIGIPLAEELLPGKSADKANVPAVTINSECNKEDTNEPNRKQWSTLFKDNRAPTEGLKLRYIPPTSDFLDFSDRVLPSMVDIFGYCLVGFFTGRFPGLKATYSLAKKWGVHCEIKPHDKGWVVFKFKSEADRTKVMLEGPYILFGKLLVLKVLSDDFSFEDEEFLKVPIWIKFPKLPVRLWNEDTISEVASMVGVPLTTDRITLEKANHNFARVLIEVDVTKPPPLSFPIKMTSGRTFEQRVLYETFPNYCFHCKQYGHHPFICKKLAAKGKAEISEPEKVEAILIAREPATKAIEATKAIVVQDMVDPEGEFVEVRRQKGKMIAKLVTPSVAAVLQPAAGPKTAAISQAALTAAEDSPAPAAAIPAIPAAPAAAIPAVLAAAIAHELDKHPAAAHESQPAAAIPVKPAAAPSTAAHEKVESDVLQMKPTAGMESDVVLAADALEAHVTAARETEAIDAHDKIAKANEALRLSLVKLAAEYAANKNKRKSKKGKER